MEKEAIYFLNYENELYVSENELKSKIDYLCDEFKKINNKDHFHHSQYWCGLMDISSQLNWNYLPGLDGIRYVKKQDLIKLIEKEKKAKLTMGISIEYLNHMEQAFDDLENLISV